MAPFVGCGEGQFEFGRGRLEEAPAAGAIKFWRAYFALWWGARTPIMGMVVRVRAVKYGKRPGLLIG